MTKAGFVALATWALLFCAGCSAHSFSLYPTPERSFSTYTSVRQLRADRTFDAAASIERLTPIVAEASLGRRAVPSGTMSVTTSGATTATIEGPAGAPSASAGSGANANPDAPNRFVCTDGTTLDVGYTLDRRTALVRIGDAAPIEMARTEDRGLPTYVQGDATLRSLGPRIGWSTSEGAATVTIEAGDTLSAIALRRYGSLDAVDAIMRANSDVISDADLIFPGQVLALPGATEQSCRKLASAERA